ncbi:MFS transporter [Mammaliicoccus sciuri]|uniref:MFS transporter n=1 Tax=Mammaliicoccus sciuri TaxID=1296 RepID=UPI001071A691|nr:MFS transporter [Mammaliicoccus sciuri]MBF0773759.1 MFS transporter [Mammaliicoccus sciuri]TFU86454.1 MFS transporter [Mammaliicoccus sciuri]
MGDLIYSLKLFINNKRFTFLWLCSFSSFLALSTYIFAEQWYILKYLDANKYLGLIMMLTMLPRIILMFIGGVIADRFKKSTIMFISSAFRAIVLIIMVVFINIDALDVLLLSMFAIIYGCLDAFFSPANSSMIPNIVEYDDIRMANSIIQTTNQISLFLGPMIGGVMFSLMNSFIILFVVPIVLLVLTAVFSFMITEEKCKGNSEENIKEELINGLAYVWSQKDLKLIIILIIIVNFWFLGPLMLGIPLVLNNVIKGTALQLSAYQGSYQVGMLVGALSSIVLLKRISDYTAIPFLIFIIGSTFLLFGNSRIFLIGIFTLLVMGICSAIINVLLISKIQEKTDNHMLGRVMSIVNASSNGLIPLSYALISLLLGFNVGISSIISVSAVIVILVSIMFIIYIKKGVDSL